MRNQSNNHIKLNGYEIKGDVILGKGATGNVYKGIRVSDGVKVAIKAIDMTNINNEVTQYLLEGEKRALTEIKHPYVIKCQEIIQNKDFCFIVMEQCTGGTLRDLIKNKGPFSQSQAINIFRKIVHGYCKIIDSKIIHRDLKTANIMLRANRDPAIIDFGYCQMIMGKRPMIKYNVGSPSYMSPEAYQHSRYSEKSDVWALGIILYQMITGKTLDEGIDIKNYFDNIKKRKVANLNLHNCSQLIRKLLQSSLTICPEDRVSSCRLKYLIDISVRGPLINPEGMSIKLQQKNYGNQTPIRTTYHRQDFRSDVNIRQFNQSLNKQHQHRKSSLNLNENYICTPTFQYNKIINGVNQKVGFLNLSNSQSRSRNWKLQQNNQKKVIDPHHQNHQIISNHHYPQVYGFQFKRLY